MAWKKILADNSHRPWEIPATRWRYYQEWNRAIFLHWKLPPNQLEKLIPDGLQLDTFEGNAWITLVAFTMQKITLRNVPPITPLSNFHEINVRTYLGRDKRPGVYFLSMEGGSHSSVFLSKLLSGLPYETASMKRSVMEQEEVYASKNKKRSFDFYCKFSTGEAVTLKTPLDTWLTERYCLYFERGNNLYRYETQHQPWPLQKVTINKLTCNYQINNVNLDRQPDLIHYSPGVKVLAWERELIER